MKSGFFALKALSVCILSAGLADSYPDPWMFDHSILPAWGLYARHVDGLTLRNVDFRLEPNDFTDNSRVDQRKKIVRDDVKER